MVAYGSFILQSSGFSWWRSLHLRLGSFFSLLFILFVLFSLSCSVCCSRGSMGWLMLNAGHPHQVHLEFWVVANIYNVRRIGRWLSPSNVCVFTHISLFISLYLSFCMYTLYTAVSVLQMWRKAASARKKYSEKCWPEFSVRRCCFGYFFFGILMIHTARNRILWRRYMGTSIPRTAAQYIHLIVDMQ